MCFSIEPRDANKAAKNLNNKYGQKLADTAKKSCNRCIKNC